MKQVTFALLPQNKDFHLDQLPIVVKKMSRILGN